MIGTVVGAAMSASVALAQVVPPDDVQPPPWRGQFSTTSQFWLFNTPDLLVQPDGPIPAHGGLPPGAPWLPSTRLTVQPLGPWIQSDQSGRIGIWPLSGTMNVIVDNHPEPNPVKYMWVQVVWQDIPGLPHTGPELSGFNPLASTPLTAVGPVDLGFGWFETTYKWEIRPNPRDEFFILGGNINVDQLLIDTWCIPEPGTGLLTVLGGGLLLVFRRRRQR